MHQYIIKMHRPCIAVSSNIGVVKEAFPLERGGTAVSLLVTLHDRIYPRTRGGTSLMRRCDQLLEGLSPRTRGNRNLVIL